MLRETLVASGHLVRIQWYITPVRTERAVIILRQIASKAKDIVGAADRNDLSRADPSSCLSLFATC